MDPRDTLTVFAQVSVAFAGFGGLAGLFARRLRGDAALLAAVPAAELYLCGLLSYLLFAMLLFARLLQSLV